MEAVHARVPHVDQHQVRQRIFDKSQLRFQIPVPCMHRVAVFDQDRKKQLETCGLLVMTRMLPLWLRTGEGVVRTTALSS